MRRCRVASRSQLLQIVSRMLGSIALLAGLLMLNSIADARTTDPAQGGAIALAFDGGSQTLLRASADTLSRSGDGGRHWVPMKLPQVAKRWSITSVAVSAGTKGAIYVAGPGIGVLRSEDGGRSWSARNESLPRSTVVALATHAEQPDTVYAYVEGHGIFRSQDGGLHWKLMDAGPRGGIVGFVHSNMPGSMQTGWLFAASRQGVHRAMDCFCGWRDAGELGRAVTAVAYDPRRPQNIYAATHDGLFLSANGGEQWSRVNAPAAALTALIITPAGVRYAAASNGSVFRSSDNGRTWERADAQPSAR